MALMDEINNLDFNNMGSWPMAFKAVLLLILCVAVLGAGIYFDTKPQLEQLALKQDEEVTLKQDFEGKQRQAASLEPLKRQLEEMKQSFADLLRLLPNKTQIEGLLVDISQAGLASGLEFELFKPASEKKEEFIATLPISIRVTGRYHEFGEFISQVAALPRIVTQHNIQVVPRKGKADGGGVELMMNMTARTYRYLEEDEIEEAEAGKKKK